MQQQQHQEVGTEGGKGEAVKYLFGAAQEWRQQAEASKGQLSAVGSTVQLLLSQQAGGGPTLENVLPTMGRQCQPMRMWPPSTPWRPW